MKVDVSIAEVVDKVTILEIKLSKVTDIPKWKNVKKEYQLLLKDINKIGINNTSEEFTKLKSINLQLWDIEDSIRIKESKKEFDKEFIELARSVYFKNDERSNIKKEINLQFNSELIEEKSYVNYRK